jgi:uncharacterized protein (DUF2252 family)
MCPIDTRRALGHSQPMTNVTELGAYLCAPDRPDPIATLLAQGESRVPALLPIRYSRMSASAFAFYRGSAAVMANDLGPRPRSGLQVQLCGDAHLGNFGIFATADRATIFDVNDFDETFPGPFEWDVQRMVTSFAIAAANRPEKYQEAITLAGAEAYRVAMAAFASATFVDTWYFRVDASRLEELTKSGGLPESSLAEMNKGFSAAEKRDQWSAIRKLTVEVNGQRQFVNKPPLVVRLSLAAGVMEAVNRAFDRYKETLLSDRQILLDRYRIVDFGHKVVGVGSIGLLAYIVLLQGRDANDLLVLQVKVCSSPGCQTSLQKVTVSGSPMASATSRPQLMHSSDGLTATEVRATTCANYAIRSGHLMSICLRTRICSLTLRFVVAH